MTWAEIETAAGGAPDVLVHAAGGVRGQCEDRIEDVTDADWQAIMDANVTSAFNLARAAAPSMKARGSGRIVMISSQAGSGVSLTGIAAYGTAKAAEIGFVRQLAQELGSLWHHGQLGGTRLHADEPRLHPAVGGL